MAKISNGMNKKYLIAGLFLLLSFSIFLPKAFALPACTQDDCPPGGFSCDESTGVCTNVGAGNGDFDTRVECRVSCKPQNVTLSIVPLTVNVVAQYADCTAGDPNCVTATWGSDATPFVASCTGYVNNPDGSGGIKTDTIPIPPSGNAKLYWSVPGSYSVHISCTNPSGTVNSPTRTVVVKPKPTTNPTLSISASPQSGTVSLSGTVNYSLASNDNRVVGDFTCLHTSSPVVTGWESGTAALLNGAGNGSRVYGPINTAGTYTVGISCIDENTGADAGSKSTTITANPYTGPQHFSCVSNSCTLVNGSGPDSCDTNFACGTGALTIQPVNGCAMADGTPLVYSVFYKNGATTDRIGEGASINSDNLSVISRTAADATTANLVGHKVGSATVSGTFQGLTVSTPVTVSDSCHKVNFSASPINLGAWNLSDHGGLSQDVNIYISGGPPSAWGDLSRSVQEWDLVVPGPGPGYSRSFNQSAPAWKQTDASGNNNSLSYHSCDNDGQGVRVRGFRQENNTMVNFPGWGQSNKLDATKDCRATVVVNNPQGCSWNLSGMTPENSSNIGPLYMQQFHDLGGGDDISFGVTDGTYNISSYSPCGLLGPSSQAVIPGHTIIYSLYWGEGCSAGQNDPHYTCQSNSCVQVSGCGANQGGCASAGQNCGGQPTLVVTPSSATINQGSSANFRALYDPDGPGGAQPQQDVTQTAAWSSSNNSIASPAASKGRFSGNSAGTAVVSASYSGLSAQASLNVQASSDFSLTIVPASRTVAQGNSGTYTISAAAQGAFSGNINLRATGLPSGVSVSFSPSSITTSTQSTLTADVSISAAPGAYTFFVEGRGGSPQIIHSYPVGITITGGGNRYSCSGASCVLNPAGPYATANCNNACGGGGCGLPNTNPYSVCQSGSCVSVPSCGLTDCSACGGGGCGLPNTNPHSACVSGSCVSVPSCGLTDCSSCGGGCQVGQTNPYNTCVSGSCTSIPSCGVDSGGCNSGNAGSPCAGGSASCTMSANPSIIDKGNSSKVSWSCVNTSNCSISVCTGLTTTNCTPSGIFGTSGNKLFSPASTTTYTVSCVGGGNAQATVRVRNVTEGSP